MFCMLAGCGAGVVAGAFNAGVGCLGVVLGCTEIPLAIKEVEEQSIPIVNSIDSLVKLAIKALAEDTIT